MKSFISLSEEIVSLSFMIKCSRIHPSRCLVCSLLVISFRKISSKSYNIYFKKSKIQKEKKINWS